MYRGRPLPPRGGYPQQCEGRGPTPVRPYPGPPFREERGRPRPPFQGYHDGPPDPYRRSPPLRRYPSPDSVSHRGPGGEYWGSGPPPREVSAIIKCGILSSRLVCHLLITLVNVALKKKSCMLSVCIAHWLAS